jgi:hypothetical protein
MPPRKLLTALVWAVVVLGTAYPALADGQDYHEKVELRTPPPWLTLPFESGHAAAWVPERIGPVYKWNLSLLPGVRLGDLATVQGVAQWNYRNPDGDFGFGGRATVLLGRAFGGFVPTHLVLEGTHFTASRGGRLAVGPEFGLGRLIYLIGYFGWETDRREYIANFGVGADLMGFWDPVGAITHYVPQKDLGDGSR